MQRYKLCNLQKLNLHRNLREHVQNRFPGNIARAWQLRLCRFKEIVLTQVRLKDVNRTLDSLSVLSNLLKEEHENAQHSQFHRALNFLVHG